MATGMFGADPDGLRSIGGRFHGAGDLVERAGFDLRGQIENLEWFGPDADAYREVWSDRLVQDFSALSGELRQFRGELDRQADAQEQASAAGSNEGCLESTWNGLGSFFGNFFGAVWGDVKGLASLIGFDDDWNWSWDNLTSTWAGMGTLIGYNPADGTWGNWGLAGDTWKALGKDILAWDQWADDPWGAAGTVLWNVGSMFIGVGIVGKVGKVGKIGSLVDDLGDAGAVGRLDEAADAGAAGRVDDAADAGAAGRADEAAGAGRADDANSGRGNGSRVDEHGWAASDGRASPDVLATGRVDGADPIKMNEHLKAYDTGATIDPNTGELISTSGERFTRDQVSEHYTTTTGEYNADLNPRTATREQIASGETVHPFEPDHRYVLDDGRTVIETNASGVPVYTRYHHQGTMPDAFETRTGGSQTVPASKWPGEIAQPGDHRGHISPAHTGGPNEGINTPPQPGGTNLSGQKIIDNAIDRAYDATPPSNRPLIVEQHNNVSPTGRAESYEWTVTDSKGNEIDLTTPSGDPLLPYVKNP